MTDPDDWPRSARAQSPTKSDPEKHLDAVGPVIDVAGWKVFKHKTDRWWATFDYHTGQWCSAIVEDSGIHVRGHKSVPWSVIDKLRELAAIAKERQG